MSGLTQIWSPFSSFLHLFWFIKLIIKRSSGFPSWVIKPHKQGHSVNSERGLVLELRGHDRRTIKANSCLNVRQQLREMFACISSNLIQLWYSCRRASGEQRELTSMRLNYSDAGLHAASFPVNPCCMSRPYESCRGMADTDAKNGNCHAEGNRRAAKYVYNNIIILMSAYKISLYHDVV